MKNDLIFDYIKALVNLNGIVSIDKVVEIFNMQNEEKIDLADIEKVIKDYDLEGDFIHIHKDYFLQELVTFKNSFAELKEKKKGKPYYIPQKEQLLKYEDELYFEKTPEYNKLKAFIKKEFAEGDDYYAEGICDDIYDICTMDFNINDALNEFQRRDISFKSQVQVQKVLGLIMDLSNNVRIWENNGHTPNEIFELMEKPNLKPLPKGGFNILDTKVGRNDPCPCGSGKKYKKCCGKDIHLV